MRNAMTPHLVSARQKARELEEIFPFESQYITVGGHACHYVDEGRGEPVVAVHGNPTWSFAFRHIIRHLAGRYRMIALDHIGCGLSAKPSDSEYPYDLARRVDDFGEFVDRLDLDRLSLIVHDWGGVIATAWAVRNPSRVRAMVVLNSAAFLPPPSKRIPFLLLLARSRFPGALLVRGTNLFVRSTLLMGAARGRLTEAERRGYLLPYASWKERLALYRFVQDIPVNSKHRSHDLLRLTADQLAQLHRVPTLLCWGMRDFVFDDTILSEWISRIPAAQVERYPEARHLVFEDAHGPLEGRIERFFADVLRH
jgi:cis-3-alkyl-4-acyloxetan-2-one decarboxylase